MRGKRLVIMWFRFLNQCSFSETHHVTFPGLSITVRFQHWFLTSGSSASMQRHYSSSFMCSHKKNWTNQKRLFKIPSEKWGCRANCIPEIWKDKQIQRVKNIWTSLWVKIFKDHSLGRLHILWVLISGTPPCSYSEQPRKILGWL